MPQAPATSLPALDGYFAVTCLQAYRMRQNCRFQENVACKMPTIATSLDSCLMIVDFFYFFFQLTINALFKINNGALMKFFDFSMPSSCQFSHSPNNTILRIFFPLIVQKSPFPYLINYISKKAESTLPYINQH